MITTGLRLADVASGQVATLDRDDFDMPYPRGLMAEPIESNRTVIAAVCWRVVAEFTSDYEPISPAPGLTLAETCEDYVRRNAEEAEGCTLTTGALITPVLHSLGLLDDYLRMKSGEQGWAFEES